MIVPFYADLRHIQIVFFASLGQHYRAEVSRVLKHSQTFSMCSGYRVTPESPHLVLVVFIKHQAHQPPVRGSTRGWCNSKPVHQELVEGEHVVVEHYGGGGGGRHGAPPLLPPSPHQWPTSLQGVLP